MQQIKNNLNSEAVSPVIGVMLMLVVTVIIAAVVSGFAGDMGLDKKTGPCVTLSKPVMEFSTADGVAANVEDIRYWYSGTGTAYFGDGSGTWWEIDEQGSGYIKESSGAEGHFHIVEGGMSDPFGLVFTHMGGDPIDLKELQMGFSSNDLGIVVDYNSRSVRAGTSSHKPYSGDWYIGYTHEENFDNFYRIEYVIDTMEITGGYTAADFDNLQYRVDNAETDPGRYFLKINPETPGDTIIRTGDQFEVAMDGTPSAWAIQAYTSDGVYKSFLIEAGSGNEWILSHRPSGQILARGDLVYETTPNGLVF